MAKCGLDLDRADINIKVFSVALIHISYKDIILITIKLIYLATITLYGDVSAMNEGPVGRKYVWCSTGSVCEFHGQEKLSWTLLNDTLFKQNSPVDVRYFDYTPDGNRPTQGGDGLMFHRFSRYGAWKDSILFLTKVSLRPSGQSPTQLGRYSDA